MLAVQNLTLRVPWRSGRQGFHPLRHLAILLTNELPCWLTGVEAVTNLYDGLILGPLPARCSLFLAFCPLAILGKGSFVIGTRSMGIVIMSMRQGL